jgi:predicted RNA-binding Zn-ribbon protein involved in translation (DUF1610 family)
MERRSRFLTFAFAGALLAALLNFSVRKDVGVPGSIWIQICPPQQGMVYHVFLGPAVGVGFPRVARTHYDDAGRRYVEWSRRGVIVDAAVAAGMVALCGVFGPNVAAAVVRGRRRLRIKGICALCGYDLRATPNQCPECGETVERETSVRWFQEELNLNKIRTFWE